MRVGSRRQRVGLAVFAAVLGAALMVGESVRSLGQGRPFFAWFDDFIIAFFLFFAAYKAIQHGRNVKYLSAAFAVCVTGIAMSFLSKVMQPEDEIHSNVSFSVLTTALLLAFLASLIGLVWTLAVHFEDEPRKSHCQ